LGDGVKSMTSSLEDIKSIDLEEWLTLATAPAPTKLKQGQTPDMQNVWTDEKPGSIITAPGFKKVGQIPSGNPVTFCINFFRTSAGTQTFVVSDNATVWTTVDFQTFTSIITGLSSSFQLRGAIIRDKLWLTNGSDAVRVFNGTTVSVLDSPELPTGIVFEGNIYNWQSSAGQVSTVSPAFTTVVFVGGGTAGAETVTVVGGTITIKIQSGVSTANNIVTAIDNTPAAVALITVQTLGGQGATVQIAPNTIGPFVGGSPNAPRGRYIAYHDERVWLYHISSARSAVYFSSLSDSAGNEINPDDIVAWDTVDNFLQISEGDADFGTGMILYRGYLHFFKQYSIWRLVGYDEYTYSRVKTRASTGTRFNESIQILDSLVHLIGVDGIYVFDGEESVRISDIIDPATASQTAFGFNQLQQPNQNNQFWEVTATADWNTGTIPRDLVVDDAITLQAADDSQADFQAGNTLTNIDTTYSPGNILLTTTFSPNSASNPNVALNQTVAVITATDLSQVGNVNSLTDGDLVTVYGATINDANGLLIVRITFPVAQNISKIVLKGLQENNGVALKFFYNFNTQLIPNSGSTGFLLGSKWIIGSQSATDVTFFTPDVLATSLDIYFYPQAVPGTFTLTEIQVFQALYSSSGTFISRTLDLGITPASLGTFNATETLNGETTAYSTQSSPDGMTWDAAVSCTNGGAIGSVPRRYLRWKVIMTSDGLNTPVISAAYLPAVYVSAIHNTGGGIFAWGPLEAVNFLAAQTINYYYRAAITSGGVSAASWNLIVPGGVINVSTTLQYIQFKIEISGGSVSNLPSITSVTINWITGSAGQPQTLQNVASTYWRNRYWLSAAGPSATANNLILIRGKKTFNSPWMLKDWKILSFTRYFDSLYGGSSVDGSIYQLDTGYSENGVAMDSHFETHDFTFGGFTANFVEVLVESQRSGPWKLNVGVSIDGGNTFDTYTVDLTPSTFDSEYIKRIHINYTTTRIRFKFSTAGVDTPFEVHRFIAFYQLSGARGSIRGDYM
jgi:hypothetical protein